MGSRTETLRRPVVRTERLHDYLYDPLYTTSSDRDHARNTFAAHTTTDRVKRIPVYPTMFSELRHHPRFQVQLDHVDPVPQFISRQWRGYADQARYNMSVYKSEGHAQLPPKTYEDFQVSGPNRYKFFRRPIIPFMSQMAPDVVLASTRQDMLQDPSLLNRPSTPPTKTTETQTDYRESEAQTDPYTPEYVIQPGMQPELLTLATLSYGRGLPAGLPEVEMIERARQKRAWEETLPALNDITQLEKRKSMMEQMERDEWAQREREIEKLQEARLEVLKKLLAKREEHHQEVNTKRLDRLWAKKQAEKDSRVKIIRNEHIKSIRKLTKKRSQVEGMLERRNVGRDYCDYGSQVYAPLTRVGVFLDRGSENHVVKNRFLTTYQGLLELENSLPDYVTQPRFRAPRPVTTTKKGYTKRKYKSERELKEVHDMILENKRRTEEAKRPLKFLQKIEKVVPRPPTPQVEVPSHDEEEKELAAIFLQQIIRGRAVQNMMFEGKEKRIELIRELRSTHALQDAEQKMKKQEKMATEALQRQRRLHDHKEAFIDEAMSQMEGESLGDMLDFLGKELTRLQEERRIHAFSMLADRERRIREAEESGKRQVEERRRREEDEIFKQMVKITQSTVDTYLEDIIMLSVDKTAEEQSREEIQVLAKTINDVAYDIEDKRTEVESEDIVAELVHGFMLPEVQKQHVREKVKQKQRKYLMAAHQEIIQESSNVNEQQESTRVEYPSMSEQVTTESSITAAPNTLTRTEILADMQTQDIEQITASRSGSKQSSRGGTPPGSQHGSVAGTPRATITGSSVQARSHGTLEDGQKVEQEGQMELAINGSKPSTPIRSRPNSSQQRASSRSGSRQSSAKSARSNQEQQPSSRPASRQASGKPAESTPEQASSSRPTSRPASGKPAVSNQEQAPSSRPTSRPTSGKPAVSTQEQAPSSRPTSRPSSGKPAEFAQEATPSSRPSSRRASGKPAESTQEQTLSSRPASRPASGKPVESNQEQAPSSRPTSRPASGKSAKSTQEQAPTSRPPSRPASGKPAQSTQEQASSSRPTSRPASGKPGEFTQEQAPASRPASRPASGKPGESTQEQAPASRPPSRPSSGQEQERHSRPPSGS